MINSEYDSLALLGVVTPDFNENKNSHGTRLCRGKICPLILNLSCSIWTGDTCCIQICRVSVDRSKGREKALSCSTWCSATHVETCQVSLYIAVSSWSYIHHPLHLALAHMGGEQAHQGHCLWLMLKSMKAAFTLHAIHLCFCFLCLQRFVLHIELGLQL